MTQAQQLNSRTTDYLSLIGNGRVYRVPRYQRDYSWSQEHWEDLWNDILELRAGGADKHYLGALVFQPISDREFAVIDGQQRLTTLSVLALAVIQKLEDLADAGVDADANRDRSKTLRGRFVGDKDPASLYEYSRLTLNGTNDGFYQDFLVQLREPYNVASLPATNQQLWEAFRYFRTRLDSMPDLKDDGEALASIVSETVARGLLFIVISVEDELNAYTVFETINARGTQLTTTDLLKNYLFSKVRVESDAVALDRRWRDMVATVEPRRFPGFLRHHMLCTHPKVHSRRMFKLLRSQNTNTHDVFALVNAIEPRGELFAALGDPTHDYWIGLQSAQRAVSELVLFGARQMTSFLFAAWDHLSREEFVRCMRLVSTITFRHSVVSKLQGARLESASHRAAKALAAGEVRTAREVMGKLESVYVEDAQFRKSFGIMVVTNSQRKLIRYLLARLETDASGRECDYKTDPGTIEHILPQNPADGWEEAFTSQQRPSAVSRLGNLTLLEQEANKRIGNVAYSTKVVEYARSAYTLTRQVAEMAPEEWTWAFLDKRQAQMAKRATHLWRVDM